MSYFTRSLTYAIKPETSKLQDTIASLDRALHHNVVLDFYHDLKNFFKNLRWLLPQAWKLRSWNFNHNIELFCRSLEETGKEQMKGTYHKHDYRNGVRAIFAAHKLRTAYEYSDFDDKSYAYLSKQNPFDFINNRFHRDYKQSEGFFRSLHKVTSRRVRRDAQLRKADAWGYVHKYIERFGD